MINYKQRCKNCCYMYISTDMFPQLITNKQNKKWCCECYEKFCEQIYKCPQVDDVDIVEVK